MIADEYDGRELTLDEIFWKLKELLSSKLGKEINVKIRAYSSDDAKKIMTFVSLSGCQTKVDKTDGCYIIHITGSPCCA